MEGSKDTIEDKKVKQPRKIRNDFKGDDALRRQSQYYNDYYTKNLTMIIKCDRCNKEISKGRLTKHKMTKKCQALVKLDV